MDTLPKATVLPALVAILSIALMGCSGNEPQKNEPQKNEPQKNEPQKTMTMQEIWDRHSSAMQSKDLLALESSYATCAGGSNCLTSEHQGAMWLSIERVDGENNLMGSQLGMVSEYKGLLEGMSSGPTVLQFRIDDTNRFVWFAWHEKVCRDPAQCVAMASETIYFDAFGKIVAHSAQLSQINEDTNVVYDNWTSGKTGEKIFHQWRAYGSQSLEGFFDEGFFDEASQVDYYDADQDTVTRFTGSDEILGFFENNPDMPLNATSTGMGVAEDWKFYLKMGKRNGAGGQAPSRMLFLAATLDPDHTFSTKVFLQQVVKFTLTPHTSSKFEVRDLGLPGSAPVITIALAGAVAVGLFSLGALTVKRMRGAAEMPLASLAEE